MPTSHWSLYKQTSVSLYEDKNWVGRLYNVVHFNFVHWTSSTLVGVCNAEWLDRGNLAASEFAEMTHMFSHKSL